MAYTTIDKPTDYFNTKLYTGTGSSQSITGINFQPDWIWIKYRGGTGGHNLFDSVRGALKRLRTDSANGETTTATDTLTSFDSDGFSLGADTFGDGVNLSGYNNVAWNWLAGGTASSNTDGSVTTTVSANQTAGFSIGTYAGSASSITCGHGLNAVPKMIICKTYDTSATNWQVYHVGMGNGYRIYLNLTNAQELNSNAWNDTTPTSSVFTLGTAGDGNYPGRNFVFYCFAEIKGFSKFGSYTGNGNADGPFIYTGFKPAFIIGRNTSRIEDWFMLDNKRDTFNPVDERLQPNSNGAEVTVTTLGIDFCSNGFKLRGATNQYNASGETMIYMAFAEEPFVDSSGVPATAK